MDQQDCISELENQMGSGNQRKSDLSLYTEAFEEGSPTSRRPLLPKRQSSMLTQLRTEKIGLQDFLFNRHVPDIADPRCVCGEGRQTATSVAV
ncbi:hypothetical protein CaCOL14_001639 [Colletotrichum acutatum]